MTIISNAEFVKLVDKQSARLRTMAAERMKADPRGSLTIEAVESLVEVFRRFGEHKTATWLQNLAVLKKSGTLDRLRRNACTYQDHVREVHLLKVSGASKFDINDHVQCKESGRYGSVIDYNPHTKEFLVALDPFQIKTYTADQLDKVS